MSSDIPPLELSCFIFANLMLQLVEVGYIRLILPNSISFYVTFSIISLRHANDHNSNTNN